MLIDTLISCITTFAGGACAVYILASKHPVWVKIAASLVIAGWLVEGIIYLASP